MTILLNFIGIISLIFGVFIGYRFAFAIYQYISLKLPKNEAKHTQKLDTLMVVDTVLKEKYNLGGVNLYPDTSTIRDDFSTRELNEIYDFLKKWKN